MTEYSLRLAKPHCDACHKSKKIQATLEEIIPNTAISEVRIDLSLADRLSQTIQQANKQGEEEI
jgi:hypothetical protein